MESDLTEISPFTNKQSVILEKTEEGVETRICMDTGFTTSSNYKINSETVTEYEETTTKLIKELRFTDALLGQYWYPTTAMFKTGVLYPDGDKENWKWCYAPIVKLSEVEEKKYSQDVDYESKIDMDNAQYYDAYISAIKNIKGYSLGELL